MRPPEVDSTNDFVSISRTRMDLLDGIVLLLLLVLVFESDDRVLSECCSVVEYPSKFSCNFDIRRVHELVCIYMPHIGDAACTGSACADYSLLSVCLSVCLSLDR